MLEAETSGGAHCFIGLYSLNPSKKKKKKRKIRQKKKNDIGMRPEQANSCEGIKKSPSKKKK